MISSLPININDILVIKKKIPIFIYLFLGGVNFGDSSRGRCEICFSCHLVNPLLFQARVGRGGPTRSCICRVRT